jgi:threonine dehydratase
LTLIAPYDDPEVIAGLGTIGMEILRQHRGPIDAIFVPVGGGGLIADIAAYVEALEPSTRIVGVEPDDAACLDTAIEARRTRARRYVRRRRRREIGDPCRRRGRTHRSAKRAVAHRPASRPRVITTGTDETCVAIKDVFEDNRSIPEPAGALAIAGRADARRDRVGREHDATTRWRSERQLRSIPMSPRRSSRSTTRSTTARGSTSP